MLKHYFESRPHILRIILPLTVLLFLSGGSLYYWKSTSVRLTADGQTRRLFTKAHNLKDFLAEQHIALGPSDFITPPPETPIGHNTAAKITRVTIATSIDISSGPTVVTWQNRNRDNLRRVLVQRGHAVITKKKVQITKHDGVEISRAVLFVKKSRVPFFTLTFFNKEGQPAKQYNLLRCKTLRVRTTGYYVGERTVPGNTTYLGYKLQRGLVAVDPKVIPLRTRLYISGYGYAYAADTGSAINGLHIDLAVKDKYEEARFNRYEVPVYILEKAKKW
jgi:3D (Asp-Asp-Asp) domain-containing protein